MIQNESCKVARFAFVEVGMAITDVASMASISRDDHEWFFLGLEAMIARGEARVDEETGELHTLVEEYGPTNGLTPYVSCDLVCCCGRELDGSHDHNTCGPPVPRYP